MQAIQREKKKKKLNSNQNDNANGNRVFFDFFAFNMYYCARVLKVCDIVCLNADGCKRTKAIWVWACNDNWYTPVCQTLLSLCMYVSRCVSLWLYACDWRLRSRCTISKVKHSIWYQVCATISIQIEWVIEKEWAMYETSVLLCVYVFVWGGVPQYERTLG